MPFSFLKFLKRKPANLLTKDALAKKAGRHGWRIGDFSYGRVKVRDFGQGAPLVIGPYCSFADRIEIFLGGDHAMSTISTYPFAEMAGLFPVAVNAQPNGFSKGGVTIGADVWVGAGATIMAGVTIGPGAVIGARAVVAKDVPPYAVVVGNPARVIKTRLPADAIEALLAARWWDLPPAEVAAIAPLLVAGDWRAVAEACAAHRRQ